MELSKKVCTKWFLMGRKEAAEGFIKDLNKINKIVVGGCPKVNVITEIFEMKKKWKKEVKEIEFKK